MHKQIDLGEIDLLISSKLGKNKVYLKLQT